MKNKSILSLEAVGKILNFEGDLTIDLIEMAKKLRVTFFPYEGRVSPNTRKFFLEFKNALELLGLEIVPFQQALIQPGRKAIKEHICVIVLGEQRDNDMPIDYAVSIRNNLILTIIDDYMEIKKKEYSEQLEAEVKLLSWLASNLVICVGEDYWLAVAATGVIQHSLDFRRDNFQSNILNTVISKMYAPLKPLTLHEFTILEKGFDADDHFLSIYIQDIVQASQLFSKTHLMDFFISLDEIPCKKKAYREIVKMLLDGRSGTSYGFFSRQLPVVLSSIYNAERMKELTGVDFQGKDYVSYDEQIYIKYRINGRDFCLEVPPVEVLTTISGIDKKNIKPSDIVKMGIKSGKMYLQFEKSIDLSRVKVRPSFDTKVIFTHAVCNAIFASIIKEFFPHWKYPNILRQNGMALAHWHGYILPEFVPHGWVVYGTDNPAFMCSTQQSGIVAFRKKEQALLDFIVKADKEFYGDIHIEPQHGTNISWPSLSGLGYYLLSYEKLAKLGYDYFESVKRLDHTVFQPLPGMAENK